VSLADLAHLVETPEWREQGACWDTNPAVFFPTHGSHAAAAHRICQTCPVTAECLAYALTVFPVKEDRGVWGATSPRTRRLLRQEPA
jgi:WhiB family transcriptional regulator, redox-sensing transcriptional regulator